MLSDSFEKLHLTVTGRKSGDTFAEGADVNDALETLLKHFGIRDRKIPASLKGFEEKWSRAGAGTRWASWSRALRTAAQ